MAGKTGAQRGSPPRGLTSRSSRSPSGACRERCRSVRLKRVKLVPRPRHTLDRGSRSTSSAFHGVEATPRAAARDHRSGSCCGCATTSPSCVSRLDPTGPLLRGVAPARRPRTPHEQDRCARRRVVGTTFCAKVLVDAGNDVTLWARRLISCRAGSTTTHRNEDYLPGIELPAGVVASHDAAEALHDGRPCRLRDPVPDVAGQPRRVGSNTCRTEPAC